MDPPKHLHVPSNEHSHLHETFPQDHLHDRFNQDYLNAYDHNHPHHHPYHHPISTANHNFLNERHAHHAGHHSSHHHAKDHHGLDGRKDKDDKEAVLEKQMATENTKLAVRGFLDYMDKNNDQATLKHDYEKSALDPLDPRATVLDSVSRSALHHYDDGYMEIDDSLDVIDETGIDDFKKAIGDV